MRQQKAGATIQDLRGLPIERKKASTTDGRR
jgi:hypothetical protein